MLLKSPTIQQLVLQLLGPNENGTTEIRITSPLWGEFLQ